jgi:hypothetical protein
MLNYLQTPMLPKNIYKQYKAVIMDFIKKTLENKPALGKYLDKHYIFDDIRRTIRYTGEDSALGNLIGNVPRGAAGKSRCFDCKKYVHKNPRDFYMVTDMILAKYGVGKDELCMGCLEKRMSRLLERSDILECPVSTEWNPYTSNILKGLVLTLLLFHA